MENSDKSQKIQKTGKFEKIMENSGKKLEKSENVGKSEKQKIRKNNGKFGKKLENSVNVEKVEEYTAMFLIVKIFIQYINISP